MSAYPNQEINFARLLTAVAAGDLTNIGTVTTDAACAGTAVANQVQ